MLQIDLISIFPDYLSPLKLSLLGKAQDKGIVSINIHDLREQTNDVHHSVDDTPYGGGAGMVMSAEPWGKAIDAITNDEEQIDLIILTPAGKKFNQQMAAQFSKKSHLVFACGRYEGIDARVGEFYAAKSNFKVHEVSIGDYVLGGGEVAAMVIIEATTRLIWMCQRFYSLEIMVRSQSGAKRRLSVAPSNLTRNNPDTPSVD